MAKVFEKDFFGYKETDIDKVPVKDRKSIMKSEGGISPSKSVEPEASKTVSASELSGVVNKASKKPGETK